MISVDEAVARITRGFAALLPEAVPIAEAAGRVLAADAIAKLDQPPAPMSAMDGYAVRTHDALPGAELSIIGDAPAGRPFAGMVGAGEAVRIFTGGVVPQGADAVVIQEDTDLKGGLVVIKEAPRPAENVRQRALDFRAGEILLTRGHRLSPRDVALLAAADLPQISVTRKPRIIIVATGDELSRPGEQRKEGGIVASSTYALQAMVRNWGGEATDFGILPDRPEAFAGLPAVAKDADLIVTQGGASVGDHDLVQSALKPHGFALDFWRIAMRPGKPLIFGHLRDTPFIGLPGNPVSAMVCAVLFIQPAIAAMLGMAYEPPIARAQLASPLRANGRRQDYIRARIARRDGVLSAEPFALQDSSMQKIFAEADGLIIRRVDAPAAQAGDIVDVLMLD
ncbi:MAG: molybdopterin molybdotransferase [Alphaproteobacteria bacterium]|jgi:molybdopterin molybdotransferase|nr:molybdopterin molybdotransferase [Alphaproteobacteria bacterium]